MNDKPDVPDVVRVGNAGYDERVFRRCYKTFKLNRSLAENAFCLERCRRKVKLVCGLDRRGFRLNFEIGEGHRADIVIGVSDRHVAAAPQVAARQDEKLLVRLPAVDDAQRPVPEQRPVGSDRSYDVPGLELFQTGLNSVRFGNSTPAAKDVKTANRANTVI